MSSRVDDLLAELSAAMPHVSTPYTTADRADRVYEVYLFAQVIAAAADGGAVVEFEDHDERPVKDLILRGAPGVLHRRGRFTHALLRIGTARPVEVHLRVKVQGKTIASESDVLLLDTKNARDCRAKQQLPKAAGCVLSIEGKYYLTALPADEAFHYLGVRSSFPPSLTSLFASNSFSPRANQCLSGSRLPYELGVLPNTRFQNYTRAHIRETLRRYVARFDFDCLL